MARQPYIRPDRTPTEAVRCIGARSSRGEKALDLLVGFDTESLEHKSYGNLASLLPKTRIDDIVLAGLNFHPVSPVRNKGHHVDLCAGQLVLSALEINARRADQL